MRSLPRTALSVCLSAVALAACTKATTDVTATTSPSPHVPVAVKVAFIEDLSSDAATTRSAPAFQGAKLAFDNATLAGDLPVSLEIVGLDTKGDPASGAAIAQQIARDPSFVGAMEAPFLSATVQEAATDVLSDAGVPTFTLSTLGARLANNGWPAWRRIVADVLREGQIVGGFVDALPRPGRGMCLLGDGTAASREFLGAVATSTPTRVALRGRVGAGQEPSPALADEVTKARCGAVVWGGSAGAGGLVRRSLPPNGSRRPFVFVGGDALKDPTYLLVAGATGLGTVATCPCADLSTSTSFAARRFIQDYQSDFGLPPGPYAAEAWDVARMFLQAFRTGASTRAETRSALWSSDRFRGLANDYRFAPDGALTPGSARVRLYRDEGGRWIPIGPARSVSAGRDGSGLDARGGPFLHNGPSDARARPEARVLREGGGP